MSLIEKALLSDSDSAMLAFQVKRLDPVRDSQKAQSGRNQSRLTPMFGRDQKSAPGSAVQNPLFSHAQQHVSSKASMQVGSTDVITERKRRSNAPPQAWGYYANHCAWSMTPPPAGRQHFGNRVFTNRNNARNTTGRRQGSSGFFNASCNSMRNHDAPTDFDCSHGKEAGSRCVRNGKKAQVQAYDVGGAVSESSALYPLLYVAPVGTISILLKHNVVIELTVDKTIRVLCSGKFSAASNNRGSASCIMHPDARVFQTDTKAFAEFEKDKLAVVGSQGIIFTMKNLEQAYLVSCANRPRGTVPIPSSEVFFPTLGMDFTLTLFYEQSQTGAHLISQCEEIVRNAMYSSAGNTLCMTINDICIRQQEDGDVELISAPRNIRMSPSKGTISIRTHFVDMAILENQMAHIKRGVKRIHVSKCGLVISDGNCVAAMDANGRLVSSS